MYLQRLNTFDRLSCSSTNHHLCRQCGFRGSTPSTSTTLSTVRNESRTLLVIDNKWNSRGRQLMPVKLHSIVDETRGELLDEEDDDLCPVECVKEFKTDEEFLRILEKAKETNSLVVVDFYRTSCGSCKYIEQGFSKLCKRSGDQDAGVIFLKHNVIDEYDEESEVADRLRIRAVPLFHFYKNGVLLEAFPTRDKERIDAAVLKYTTPSPQQ